MPIDSELAKVSKLADTLIDFGVKYGFQILGALFFLFVGLKISDWLATRVTRLAEKRGIDVTLARFIGTLIRITLIGILVIITLGNFGIQVGPLIAFAGATAFGATFALQGPLSNFFAGLVLILTRPFVVGNTITVNKFSGVVEEVKFSSTHLTGEDGERIMIPNKDIVSTVIVNSDVNRIVESQIIVDYAADIDLAIKVVEDAINAFPEVIEAGVPQVGIHGFAYGGSMLAMRYWAPSRRYYPTRYAVHRSVLRALHDARIKLVPPPSAAAVLTNEGGASINNSMFGQQ